MAFDLELDVYLEDLLKPINSDKNLVAEHLRNLLAED